jgi:hypothetical protein
MLTALHHFYGGIVYESAFRFARRHVQRRSHSRTSSRAAAPASGEEFDFWQRIVLVAGLIRRSPCWTRGDGRGWIQPHIEGRSRLLERILSTDAQTVPVFLRLQSTRQCSVRDYGSSAVLRSIARVLLSLSESSKQTGAGGCVTDVIDTLKPARLPFRPAVLFDGIDENPFHEVAQ